MHEHSFIHRDIRPDNILIGKNYTTKIGDMGIAKFIGF
jgi:serine/threonine protein kinase